MTTTYNSYAGKKFISALQAEKAKEKLLSLHINEGADLVVAPVFQNSKSDMYDYVTHYVIVDRSNSVEFDTRGSGPILMVTGKLSADTPTQIVVGIHEKLHYFDKTKFGYRHLLDGRVVVIGLRKYFTSRSNFPKELTTPTSQ